MTSLHTLSRGNISLIVSEYGAELVSLKRDHREYLYQKQEGYWQRQSPVLFPIVGALSGGVLVHNGYSYGMSQHGFARDMDFNLVSQDGRSMVFLLTANQETQKKYPFLFELAITYIIEQDTVTVGYTVKNTGTELLYFSIGGHPAFALEGAISEYRVDFPGDRILDRWHLRDGLLEKSQRLDLKNGILSLSEELFEHDALIFKELNSHSVILSRGGERILTLHRGNMPHFALWRQPDSPFLCLEPWQGYASYFGEYADELSKKSGMISIDPASSYDTHWSIELENQSCK